MSTPSDRRGFLRALITLPLTSGTVVLPAAAAPAADPDAALLAAGEIWRVAVGRVYQARLARFAALDGFRETVGPCPSGLGLTHEKRSQYLAALGLQSGYISWKSDRGPMPASDPGLQGNDRTCWREVHTRQTLMAAIAKAPRTLGPAGRTPFLIREWRQLLPVATARDGVRAAAERRWQTGARYRLLRSAELELDKAREAIEALPAQSFSGLILKARLVEHEILECHDGVSSGRSMQRRSLLALFDDTLAAAGDLMPMPQHVSRWREEA